MRLRCSLPSRYCGSVANSRSRRTASASQASAVAPAVVRLRRSPPSCLANLPPLGSGAADSVARALPAAPALAARLARSLTPAVCASYVGLSPVGVCARTPGPVRRYPGCPAKPSARGRTARPVPRLRTLGYGPAGRRQCQVVSQHRHSGFCVSIHARGSRCVRRRFAPQVGFGPENRRRKSVLWVNGADFPVIAGPVCSLPQYCLWPRDLRG